MSNFLQYNWNKNIKQKFSSLIVQAQFIKVTNKNHFMKFVQNLSGAISSEDSCQQPEEEIKKTQDQRQKQQKNRQIQNQHQQKYQIQLEQQIQTILKKFKKGCFIKIAQKSAKDLSKGQHNLLLRIVKTYEDFCNVLVTSDYLLEHAELQNSQFYITFRQYKQSLDTQSYHYRVYVKQQDKIIGICQKYPNHFEGDLISDKNILKCAIKIASVIELQHFILEIYCDPYGQKFLLGVEPFYISSISLLSKQILDANLKQLQQIGKQQFYKKLRKTTVRQQSELKQQNMDEYKMTNELDNIPNAKNWLEFLSSSKK